MPDTDIRLLDEQDRAALVGHLSGLDDEGRANRFMGTSSAAMAGHYASTLDLAVTRVIGCFEADHLIGVAELHPDGLGGAEFAVSVDPDRRGHGLGSRLMDAALELATQAGLEAVTLHCLSTNRRLVAILCRRGVKIRQDNAGPFARIPLAA